MKHYFFNSFANVRSIAALGVVCMLLFAVVSCERSNVYDFDLSELNEENCIPELGGWAVELTLKSGITRCPTRDHRIRTLEARHNVTFRESFPGTSSPVLMRYYTLQGGDCNMRRARAAVRAFLATGMFEYVRVFGIATWGMLKLNNYEDKPTKEFCSFTTASN